MTGEVTKGDRKGPHTTLAVAFRHFTSWDFHNSLLI
jgi:hypothetical protein